MSNMKTMTCNQLAGACDLEFQANTFDELVQLSKSHAMEMFQKGDGPHLEAMNAMKAKMASDPAAVNEWFEAKRKEFEALPENG